LIFHNHINRSDCNYKNRVKIVTGDEKTMVAKNEVKKNEAGVSRRKFLKTAGAVAGLTGAATIAGISVSPASLPFLPKTLQPAEAAPSTSEFFPTTYRGLGYKPTTRYYYFYATDGIMNVPVSFQDLETLWSHKEIYIWGFAKPVCDKRPLGSTTTLSLDPEDKNFAYKDLELIDPSTERPLMVGKCQLPGPPIWGVEGDILEITLMNIGFLHYPERCDPHTIHLHGVHSPTYYDGIPELSFAVPMATPEDFPLDTKEKVEMFSFTYKMYCERPGTYMYHCHVEASEHVQMGMYGPLWIYPRQLGTQKVKDVECGGWAYGNPLTAFTQEATLLLSEIDSRWHDAEFRHEEVEFNAVDYRPDWWLVNGRAFPDTLLPGMHTQGYQPGTATSDPDAPNFDSVVTYYPPVEIDGVKYVIPRQPVQTYLQTGVNEKVLVRLVNMGYQAQPMHFHGVMPRIIGKDTHAWVPTTTPQFSNSVPLFLRCFTQGIFSGETYDLLAVYPDKAKLSPEVYGFINKPPEPNPFSAEATYWADVVNKLDPTVPITPLPSARDPLVETASGYFNGYPLLYLWHEHDDYKVTNNGDYPGGAVVLVKVDKKPPPPKPSIVFSLIP